MFTWATLHMHFIVKLHHRKANSNHLQFTAFMYCKRSMRLLKRTVCENILQHKAKCACVIAKRQNRAPPLHFEAYSACRPYICFIQLKPFSSLIITEGHIVIHILITGLSSKDVEGHVKKCLRLSRILNLYTYNLARLVFAWFTV